MKISNLLYVIAAGIAGYEIVGSQLAMWIKSLFYLQEENLYVKGLSNPKLFFKLFGLYTLIAWPIFLIALCHRILFNLLQCPFCLSFHLGLWTTFFLLDASIPLSMACGFMGMGISALYFRIKSF